MSMNGFVSCTSTTVQEYSSNFPAFGTNKMFYFASVSLWDTITSIFLLKGNLSSGGQLQQIICYWLTSNSIMRDLVKCLHIMKIGLSLHVLKKCLTVHILQGKQLLPITEHTLYHIPWGIFFCNPKSLQISYAPMTHNGGIYFFILARNWAPYSFLTVIYTVDHVDWNMF